MAQSKVKLFIENFLVYGVGGVISKIIPLVMVPIVTRLMPDTSYYGISDLSSTVVSFGSALAVMGMYDAMYRMFFEKDDERYKKDICSTALFFTAGTSAAVFLVMILLKDVIARFVFGSQEYGFLIYITAMATLVGATNSIVSAPTRMQNKRKVFLLMNMLGPMLSYSVSIPLLLSGRYLVALPLASLITGTSSELIFWALNHDWFSLRRFRKEHLKPLLAIAVPLLPNFLIYWVFNSCDKLMIANILDTSATGIYSVGSKLGHASQLIYTAFAGGWQFYAFSTMKEKNQVKSNSLIFEYLGIISFACTMFVFSLSKPIYELLFTGSYVSGFIVAPYLFLAPLLQMLFQVACNQFLVVKRTWPNMFILSTGAAANIVLNLWLIPRLGIEGAAIATLVGYAVSDIIGVIVLIKLKLMTIESRFLIAVCVMTTFIIIWRLTFVEHVPLALILAAVCSGMMVLLYLRDVKQLLKNLRRGKQK